MGRDVHSLLLSIQHFLCQPHTASPTVQGALKYGFGEAVLVCDMPKPCKFPSLDSCQEKFLWTYKEADLAPHPVVGRVLQVGDKRKVSSGAWFRKPGYFFSEVAGMVHVSQPEENGGNRRLVALELGKDMTGLDLPSH